MLQWTLLYIYLLKIVLMPFSGQYLDIKLLDHMANLYSIVAAWIFNSAFLQICERDKTERLSLSLWASLVAQMVKHLSAMQKPGFNPWVGKIPWRKKWQPTPVFLPGKSHGQKSPVGYSPWGCKESDMTERLHFTSTEVKWLGKSLFPMLHYACM